MSNDKLLIKNKSAAKTFAANFVFNSTKFAKESKMIEIEKQRVKNEMEYRQRQFLASKLRTY